MRSLERLEAAGVTVRCVPVPFAGPPGHPFNPLPALRMCTALFEGDERRSLALSLAAATEAAIGAGVFGVPAFAVDGELFWGGDRVEALL